MAVWLPSDVFKKCFTILEKLIHSKSEQKESQSKRSLHLQVSPPSPSQTMSCAQWACQPLSLHSELHCSILNVWEFPTVSSPPALSYPHHVFYSRLELSPLYFLHRLILPPSVSPQTPHPPAEQFVLVFTLTHLFTNHLHKVKFSNFVYCPSPHSTYLFQKKQKTKREKKRFGILMREHFFILLKITFYTIFSNNGFFSPYSSQFLATFPLIWIHILFVSH